MPTVKKKGQLALRDHIDFKKEPILFKIQQRKKGKKNVRKIAPFFKFMCDAIVFKAKNT